LSPRRRPYAKQSDPMPIWFSGWGAKVTGVVVEPTLRHENRW
jgi:hypothetical protein